MAPVKKCLIDSSRAENLAIYSGPLTFIFFSVRPQSRTLNARGANDLAKVKQTGDLVSRIFGISSLHLGKTSQNLTHHFR